MRSADSDESLSATAAVGRELLPGSRPTKTPGQQQQNRRRQPQYHRSLLGSSRSRAGRRRVVVHRAVATDSRVAESANGSPEGAGSPVAARGAVVEVPPVLRLNEPKTENVPPPVAVIVLSTMVAYVRWANEAGAVRGRRAAKSTVVRVHRQALSIMATATSYSDRTIRKCRPETAAAAATGEDTGRFCGERSGNAVRAAALLLRREETLVSLSL